MDIAERIFIASPSDLSGLRTRLKFEINNFPDDSDMKYYNAVGWEGVPGGAGRPQSLINSRLDECHYLIAIFGGKWGTPTNGFWNFSSGTEEELFRALSNLVDQSRPMKDVLVIFYSASGLHENATELKRNIGESQSLLYKEASSIDDLIRVVLQQLSAWHKFRGASRRVHLFPRSGQDYLGTQFLISEGKRYVNIGEPELGLDCFRSAAEKGGPFESLVYAKHLFRHGQDEIARDLLEKSERSATVLYGSLDEKTRLIRAEAARLPDGSGNHPVARMKLRSTLEGLSTDTVESAYISARIHDYLGILELKNNNFDDALEYFEEALRIREQRMELVNDEEGLCYSETNLARSYFKAGTNMDAARDFVERALTRERDIYNTDLLATLCGLAAEVYQAFGEHDIALEYATKSLQYNELTEYPRGRAIAHKILAELNLDAKAYDDAQLHAHRAATLNAAIRNSKGSELCHGLLERIRAARTSELTGHQG